MPTKSTKRQPSKDNIFLQNIPNILTITRIILAFVVVYLIFTNALLAKIVIVFVIAALTDFLDGKVARKFKWESEFGRKADMIADRFLWFGTALALVISFGLRDEIKWEQGIPLLLMMSREIIALPFAFIAFFSGKEIPHARYIAKVTTFLQGFALPAVILSVKYSYWVYISLPISAAACVTGVVSGLYYISDTYKLEKKN
jgi:CDP-diacylglycerol--glycerol-3-phosphate 3-phosphatidyltransferase